MIESDHIQEVYSFMILGLSFNVQYSPQDVEVLYLPQRYILWLTVNLISLKKKYCEFNTKSPTPPQQLSWFVFLNQSNIQQMLN